MTTKTSYSAARANFARLCDEVASNREVVIIRRRGAQDVALVSADELRSLMETAHLLRSPRNARRLMTALARARGGKARPQTLDQIRREVGIDAGS